MGEKINSICNFCGIVKDRVYEHYEVNSGMTVNIEINEGMICQKDTKYKCMECYENRSNK